MAKHNKKYSHFGLRDEDQDPNDPIAPMKTALVNGYGFGDRLMEDVMYKLTITSDGEIKVSFDKETKDYMEQFNITYWTNACLKYVKQNDLFEFDGGTDRLQVNLFMEDGSLNYEN